MEQLWHNGTIDILLVEDNPGDVRLTREVFKEGKVRNKLHVCSDGEEAMDYLKLRGKYTGAVRPDLVLLDLNLPRKDGRQVLEEVKEDPVLKTIPIVILTTSAAEQDILRSYNLHANCYITKPVDLNQFVRVVNYIQDYWLEIVKLPTRV
ncbi:MAG TPA: response regulator [Candidatus Binataceae bacterium]|nr:response regulator [Candidatus Binataceae bacterium]